MSAGSAATGTPPLLPMSVWISGRMVMSMNWAASSGFRASTGMTHMLPADPGARSAPGNRNAPNSKPSTSVVNRFCHQLPE